MTNAEKYLKDGVDINQLASEMVDYFNFPPYEGIGEGSIEAFFDKEIKPTLTEDERVILRNIRWKENMPATIGRDEKSGLYISFGENLQTGYWSNLFFGHLFQFIKERRRILY